MYPIKKILLKAVIVMLCCGLIAAEAFAYYAVVKVEGRKKLYTKGDIFCSNPDITDCFRIDDIRQDELILRSTTDSQDTLVLEPGQKIPLTGTSAVFEKTVDFNNNTGVR